MTICNLLYIIIQHEKVRLMQVYDQKSVNLFIFSSSIRYRNLHENVREKIFYYISNDLSLFFIQTLLVQ